MAKRSPVQDHPGNQDKCEADKYPGMEIGSLHKCREFCIQRNLHGAQISKAFVPDLGLDDIGRNM